MSLDKNYWNERYLQQETGWDLKQASPPLVAYINQLNDKSISILIPGCGNAHEAEYLLQQGFTNITLIDIAPTLVEQLQQSLKTIQTYKLFVPIFLNIKISTTLF